MVGFIERHDESDDRVLEVLRSKSGAVVGHKFRHLDGKKVVGELNRLGSKTDLIPAPEFQEDVNLHKEQFYMLRKEVEEKIKFLFGRTQDIVADEEILEITKMLFQPRKGTSKAD